MLIYNEPPLSGQPSLSSYDDDDDNDSVQL